MEEEVEGANAVTLDELARRVTAAAIFIIEMYNINMLLLYVRETYYLCAVYCYT